MEIAELEKGSYPSFAWPGGYPIGYVMDDSEMICGVCANDPTNPTHTDGENDGWKIIGIAVLEEPTDELCAHCNKALY